LQEVLFQKEIKINRESTLAETHIHGVLFGSQYAKVLAIGGHDPCPRSAQAKNQPFAK
jgi:hypothetical protein